MKSLNELALLFIMTRRMSVLMVVAGCIAMLYGSARLSSASAAWSWDDSEKGPDGLTVGRPLIIGHRGSSGMYPEHTVLSYTKAAEQGADIIECDMLITKDLKIICGHDYWISSVSNVNISQGPPHADFSDRLATYNMDDDDPLFDWNDKGNITDYFVFDFTLEELRTLRIKQRYPNRDPNFNWKYGFATLEEYVAVAKKYNVGIYPEIKQPFAVNQILKSRNVSQSVEDMVLTALRNLNYSKQSDACFLQCFELTALERINPKTQLRTMFLLKRIQKTDPSTISRIKQANIYGMAIDKNMVVTLKPDGSPMQGHIDLINMSLVQTIQGNGLHFHAFTFANEAGSLSWDDGLDPYVEYQRLVTIGLEAFFTDFPGSLANFFRFKAFQAKSSASSYLPTSLPALSVILILRSTFSLI